MGWVGVLALSSSRPKSVAPPPPPPAPRLSHLLNSSTRYSISCSAMRMALAASVIWGEGRGETGERRNWGSGE